MNKNIYSLSKKEQQNYDIERYPSNLYEALKHMEDSQLLKDTLGEHAFNVFFKTKMKEWIEYDKTVHSWEIKNYLKKY